MHPALGLHSFGLSPLNGLMEAAMIPQHKGIMQKPFRPVQGRRGLVIEVVAGMESHMELFTVKFVELSPLSAKYLADKLGVYAARDLADLADL